MSPFRLAYLNLIRRKVPTFMAILAIAISVACSGILLRLNLVSESRFETFGRGGDAIVGAKAGGIEILLGALNGEGDYPGYLPYKLFASLRAEAPVHFEDGTNSQPTYIRSVIPFVYFAKVENRFRVVGTDETFFNRPGAGDSLRLAQGEFPKNAFETVIGSQVADQLHYQVGQKITGMGWAGADTHPLRFLDLRVTGILKPTHSAWDRLLYSTLDTAKQTLAQEDLRRNSIWGPDVLNYFLVYLNPGGLEPLTHLINGRTVGQVISIPKQKQRLADLTGAGKKLGLFVTILILALGALSVTSMLVTRFEAMTLQLAVLRALGYKKTLIARWLLWEGALLGITACVVGLILDWAGFPLVRGLLGDALPPPSLVSSCILYSAPVWITAFLATLASVFIPMYRLYHQNVHLSLRG